MGTRPKGSLGGFAATSRSAAGTTSPAALNTRVMETLAGRRRPALRLFAYVALNIDGFDSADGGFSTRYGHDFCEVVSGGFAEADPAVAARIVLFGHQQIDRARFGNETAGLAVSDAFLAAGRMFVAMFAELEIAGKVQDFAGQGNLAAHERLSIDSRGHGCVRPR